MHANAAEDAIRSGIAHEGRITFAEFMELALYHPEGGYYAQGTAFGESGDYFTSPSAHPAFGALIAIQLREMWQALGRPTPFHVVEMGSGDGILARDVLEYSTEALGDFRDALVYVAVDRSLPTEHEGGWNPLRITSNALPMENITGCVLSNELLDSFPVHLFEVSKGVLLEVYVTVSNGELATSLDEPSTPLIEDRVRPYFAELTDGYRGEVNAGLGPWIHDVSEALDQGFVLTIDYGYKAENLYSPRRRHGSLQTYFRHTPGADPLQRIGRQDITAHVDFSAVVAEGAAAGLRPVGFSTQTDFLRRLNFDELLIELRRRSLPQAEKNANLMAVRELTKPEGMGSFKVLVQEKNTDVTSVDELTPRDLRFGDGGLLVPLLEQRHIELLRGRYPHLALELEQLLPDAAGERSSG